MTTRLLNPLIKTMKYRVNYPRRFEDLSETRLWMAEFVHWYNTEHLHSTIGYLTPEQMRKGQAEAIFEQRNSTMRQAHAHILNVGVLPWIQDYLLSKHASLRWSPNL